jgi:hypothetical protein
MYGKSYDNSDIVWRNNPPSDDVDYAIWQARQEGLADKDLFGYHDEDVESEADKHLSDRSNLIIGWGGLGVIALCLLGIIWWVFA